jgi:hypothetical protein
MACVHGPRGLAWNSASIDVKKGTEAVRDAERDETGNESGQSDKPAREGIQRTGGMVSCHVESAFPVG